MKKRIADSIKTEDGDTSISDREDPPDIIKLCEALVDLVPDAGVKTTLPTLLRVAILTIRAWSRTKTRMNRGFVSVDKGDLIGVHGAKIKTAQIYSLCSDSERPLLFADARGVQLKQSGYLEIVLFGAPYKENFWLGWLANQDPIFFLHPADCHCVRFPVSRARFMSLITAPTSTGCCECRFPCRARFMSLTTAPTSTGFRVADHVPTSTGSCECQFPSSPAWFMSFITALISTGDCECRFPPHVPWLAELILALQFFENVHACVNTMGSNRESASESTLPPSEKGMQMYYTPERKKACMLRFDRGIQRTPPTVLSTRAVLPRNISLSSELLKHLSTRE
ncbi:hypothetical protein B0H13DRAFT_1891859 [Mycena leptocephala]|nr:hypothetical protein B0H13DRAFT_1891859 [Mycena leptocephala]